MNDLRAGGVVLIGLMCLSGLSAGCRENTAAAAPPLTPVVVSAIGTHTAGNRTPYSAGIVPNSQVDLAFKSGGYVESILQVRGADGRMRNIQEGDWVTRGTVLARVRESDYVANVNVVEAQLAQARVDVVLLYVLEHVVENGNVEAPSFEREVVQRGHVKLDTGYRAEDILGRRHDANRRHRRLHHRELRPQHRLEVRAQPAFQGIERRLPAGRLPR